MDKEEKLRLAMRKAALLAKAMEEADTADQDEPQEKQ
jgi:hypothetical protein